MPQVTARATSQDAAKPFPLAVRITHMHHDDDFLGLEDTDSGQLSALTRARELSPGERVGRYRVLRAIGAGGVGEVYSARDQTLGRAVALKILRGNVVGVDRAHERFLFEARVTASFRHPNIITVHDVGETDDGRPWVALELLSGETLRARIARGPLSVTAMLGIARDVAAALEHAHAGRVVHRDLKPDNVFLCDDGSVRVLDFGIAKHAIGDRDSLADGSGVHVFRETSFTSAGQLVGTPAYMAPEQWMGEPADTASDVFQLGLVLYRALTGERAQGTRGAAELARAVLEPGPLPRLGAKVPLRVSDLVAACLEKDPARRPTSRAVRQALDNLVLGAARPMPALADDDTTVRARPAQPECEEPTLIDVAPPVAARASGGARRVETELPRTPLRSDRDPDVVTSPTLTLQARGSA